MYYRQLGENYNGLYYCYVWTEMLDLKNDLFWFIQKHMKISATI